MRCCCGAFCGRCGAFPADTPCRPWSRRYCCRFEGGRAELAKRRVLRGRRKVCAAPDEDHHHRRREGGFWAPHRDADDDDDVDARSRGDCRTSQEVRRRRRRHRADHSAGYAGSEGVRVHQEAAFRGWLHHATRRRHPFHAQSGYGCRGLRGQGPCQPRQFRRWPEVFRHDFRIDGRRYRGGESGDRRVVRAIGFEAEGEEQSATHRCQPRFARGTHIVPVWRFT
mmetsp:Transcript_122498/g.346402  ORF Transcript_122498/g.346402 Transcript_122498/m.346402 type:complete len:225 (+) Transcript_122498:151-825(+)